MGLFLISCLIVITCVIQTSQLPLNDRTIIRSRSPNYSNDVLKANSYFYPSELVVKDDSSHPRSLSQNKISPSTSLEFMETAANTYYMNNGEYDSMTTDIPQTEEFEFEKINPSDIRNINNTTGELVAETENLNQKPNVTQLPPTPHDVANNHKFSPQKLLFSSASATVTSNGPSGPFKAIICHDCENSERTHTGHSVSFSAIKSWNVGGSKSANTNPNEANNQSVQDSYFNTQNNDNNNNNNEMSNQKIAPLEENQKKEEENSTNQTTLTKQWNYPYVPTNGNFQYGKTVDSSSNQKKPIFTDLLKVPYDILNAPAAEPQQNAQPSKDTTIRINHQQKFNDTITSNYQHFQQFIQQKQNTMNYQTTAMPEQNYEVDESVSLMTNGRAHGVQSTTPKINTQQVTEPIDNPQSHGVHESGNEQDAKFGYVVEGRNFRKYRVEEKTPDGFIVGEYGLLNNNDGSPIQGVRYTADSNINPRLIYDALLKFLSL